VDPAAAEHLIHAYVDGWRTGDRAKILGTLAPDCMIVESYGPTYTGVDKIARWIDTWLGAGNTVDRWEVTSLEVTATGAACFFEWEFQCTFAGVRSGFAGASIARFSNNRIAALREYKMTDAPFEWEPPEAS
jgi:ketosteroid isomerase-like protein